MSNKEERVLDLSSTRWYGRNLPRSASFVRSEGFMAGLWVKLACNELWSFGVIPARSRGLSITGAAQLAQVVPLHAAHVIGIVINAGSPCRKQVVFGFASGQGLKMHILPCKVLVSGSESLKMTVFTAQNLGVASRYLSTLGMTSSKGPSCVANLGPRAFIHSSPVLVSWTW